MRGPRGTALGALCGAVVLLDVAVALALGSIGIRGWRVAGGWGMLAAGLILVPVAAANLLVLIRMLYPRAVRQAELSSERSP
jgi:hypothetical protein